MSSQATETPVNLKATQQTNLSVKLQSIAKSSSSQREFFDRAFRAIAERFDVVWGLLETQIAGRPISREYSSREMDAQLLADFAYTLSVEAQMDSVSRSRLIPTPEGNFAVIACPIVDGHTDAVSGAITYFLPLANQDEAKSKLREIQEAVSEVSRLAEKRSISTQEAPQTVKPPSQLLALVNASKYDDVRALCFALVNSYCQKFGCQKTAIGLVTDNQVKLYAISGYDSIVENSPAIIDIQQAQEECIDANRRIIVQQALTELDADSDGLLIHKKWHSQSSAAAVASVPIKVEDKTIAVFSLERNLQSPFSTEELQQIEQTIQSFGPAIQLMKRSSRSLRNHVMDSARQKIIDPFQNKVIATASLVALAFLVFGWLPYRPTVTCTIEPTSVNHLVAPFDGVLANADLFAGDEILAGQAILQFDTRELELERESILADIKSKEIQRNDAIVKREKTTASIIDAEINSQRVKLKIVERKVKQGTMVSRFDGSIIRGDLRHNIGQTIPKGTPLMEVAPKDGMRIQLAIPESKAGQIEVGDQGYFAAETRPADSHRFVITKITPSTSVVGGKNVILAEAEVEGNSDWMKTGMKGYANIRTGWKPVWWLVGHGIYDGLRLGFWL